MATPTIDSIRKTLHLMIGEIEGSLALLLQNLGAYSEERASKILAIEERINRYHIELDDHCYKYLALKAPKGKDLRFVIAWIRSNSDLERIGDEIINIERVRANPQNIGDKTPDTVVQMGVMVQQMLQDSFYGLANNSLKKLRKVFEDERRINDSNQLLSKAFLQVMQSSSELVEKNMNWIIITRCLERIGDHAVNLGENTIFIESGDDVRHPRPSDIQHLEDDILE